MGMGGIFFRRRQRAPVEVLNDINDDLVNLFRVIQRHEAAFLDAMRWALSSRAEFNRLLKTDPTTLTDIERAVRLYTMQRMNYGGLPDSESFPTTAMRAKAA